MKSAPFLIIYLKSVWMPKTAFKHRKQLNWLQLMIVFILLTLVMVFPVFTHYQNIESFSILDFYPEAAGLMDEEAIEVLQQAHVSDGSLQVEENSYLKESPVGILAIGVEAADLPEREEGRNVLLFGEDSFVIGDESGRAERVNYSKGFSLQADADREDVVYALSQLYTKQNRASIVTSFTLVIYLFQLAALTFIVFVYAYLLYLLRDFTPSDILSYKEAVHLILNLLGVPTILALIYSFFRFNVITMVGIQILGLILLLVLLYRQTKFQDD